MNPQYQNSKPSSQGNAQGIARNDIGQCAASQGVRLSQVNEWDQNLTKCITSLEDITNALLANLKPVLREANEKPCDPACPEPMLVATASALREKCERIHVITERIRTANNLLEL